MTEETYEQLETIVSVGELYGQMKVPNITVQNTRFRGDKNFQGTAEQDRFGDPRRKFTIQIPNHLADQLRAIGYNVKTTLVTPEEAAEGKEPLSLLKIAIDDVTKDENTGQFKGPNITVIQGGSSERLTNATMGLLDNAHVENVDVEIRAWEYNPKEAPNQFSARLVTLVVVIRPNLLREKYGNLL